MTFRLKFQEKMISDGVLYKKRPGRLSVLESHFSWTPDGGSGQPEVSVPYSLLKGVSPLTGCAMCETHLIIKTSAICECAWAFGKDHFED
jgi:hypothetical protein